MKRFIPFLLVLMFALQACGGDAPAATPEVATEAPAEQPSEVATEAPIDAPVLVSVDLAGPLMEVGTKYLDVVRGVTICSCQ